MRMDALLFLIICSTLVACSYREENARRALGGGDTQCIEVSAGTICHSPSHGNSYVCFASVASNGPAACIEAVRPIAERVVCP